MISGYWNNTNKLVKHNLSLLTVLIAYLIVLLEYIDMIIFIARIWLLLQQQTTLIQLLPAEQVTMKLPLKVITMMKLTPAMIDSNNNCLLYFL